MTDRINGITAAPTAASLAASFARVEASRARLAGAEATLRAMELERDAVLRELAVREREEAGRIPPAAIVACTLVLAVAAAGLLWGLA